jgi:outer membrane protein assembly factor BamB
LGVLTPEVTPIELQPMSGIEPGTRAMALGYHYPPLMVLQELPFKAATAWGAFGDLLARGEKGSVIEANLEPDVGFLGAPVFRMDTGQFAGLVSSIRTRSEDNARAAGVLTLHRSLTLLTPVDAIREFLKTNKVYPQPREDVAVIPEKTASLPLPPGDVLNLRLLPPNRELPSLFHQHYRMGLGSSYREDIVSDACYRFLGRVPSMVSEPLFDRDMLFFGSINGRFYAFDPLRGEANTFWANEGVAFLYAPAANREVVCASAGAVNLSPKARSTLLRQLTAMAARFATANVIAPQVAQVVPDIKDTGLLYAWDRATGDPKWVYPTRFLGPPKIVGNRVYFAGLGVLGALDVETGQEVWTPEKNGKNAKKDKDKGLVWYHIGHADEQNLFVMAIPVELCMEDQYQVCAAGAGDAQLQCLEPNTGKLKWQTKVASLEAAHTALSASLIYQPEDQSLWSLLGANVLTIDLTSQKKVRDYKKELPGSGKAASPTGMAYGNGILYLTSDQNFLYAVNAENGKEIWAKPFPARGKIGAPVVVKNRVYVGAADGYLYCLDAAQGSVVWKAKTGGTLLAKPVVTDDAIYCVSEEGDVHVIRVPDELNYQTAERKPSGELRRSGLELRK